MRTEERVDVVHRCETGQFRPYHSLVCSRCRPGEGTNYYRGTVMEREWQKAWAMSDDNENRRVLKACEYAARAHDWQLYHGYGDREDEPYVCHPIRVADQVQGESAKVVALLHDVLEDTDYDLPDWISTTEKKALYLLTRRSETPYDSYIRTILEADGPAGDIARCVKIADIQENLSLLPNTEEKQNLQQRYTQALAQLEQGINDRRRGEQ